MTYEETSAAFDSARNKVRESQELVGASNRAVASAEAALVTAKANQTEALAALDRSKRQLRDVGRKFAPLIASVVAGMCGKEEVEDVGVESEVAAE